MIISYVINAANNLQGGLPLNLTLNEIPDWAGIKQQFSSVNVISIQQDGLSKQFFLEKSIDSPMDFCPNPFATIFFFDNLATCRTAINVTSIFFATHLEQMISGHKQTE
jgi:hypothetical protein